jgi:Ca2+-binding RTX toxin-like protein
VATINGTPGNDTLSGTSGNDTINGLGGNDLFLARANGGSDFIHGGTGTDSIEYKERATSGIVVDFGAGTITGGGTGTISFTGVERVVAGNFNDSLSGNAAAQTLTGQAGADALWGAGGVDTLWGGSGADTFIFREVGTANADRINDWASGSDTLVLDGSVMSALGADGDFAAGDVRFWSSASGVAHDADDRIIFNTTTRQVFYDADGNGSGAAQLIATLSNATLVATDIAVEGGSNGGQPINGTAGNDSLVGTPGNDTINGFGGNDTLDGLAGDDRLFGGDGDDLLRDVDNFDEPGNDTLDGGLGNDTYDLRAGPFADHNPVLVDAGGIDTVLSDHDFVLPDGFDNLELFEGSTGRGNALNNVIVTHTNEPGLYSVDGADGNDTLLGGSDQDTFLFAAGSGNYGNDVVDGGKHFDTLSLFGARSAVVVDGRAGIITGGGIGGSGSVRYSDVERIATGSFDDRLIAHDGVTWEDPNGVHFSGPFLFAAAGNDTLTGGAADDVLQGGEGDDLISSGGGHDTVIGGSGNDRFLFDVAPGAANFDYLYDFASGPDKIVLDGRVHLASGQSGNFTAGDARFAANSTGTAQDASDRVIYNTSTGELWYDADGNGAGNAQLIADQEERTILGATDIEIINGSAAGGQVINGTPGNDTLSGTSGNDTINGLGGNDRLLAGSTGGADVFDGGTGTDSIEFKERATSAVVVDFGTGSISGGSSGTISFSNVERVVAGNFNDRLSGNAASQTLTGQNGADTLAGAGGVDTLWGGAGADRFIFREMGTANADRISDWASGSDKVALDNAVMTALGGDGNFSSGDARFTAGAGFTSGRDATDRVIYNTSTGSLYYDADGSGSGAAQLIATVLNAPAVAATDIVVI